MPTRSLGLRERNRIRTREDILTAMSVLLGERAYEDITIDDVAQRAGVSRGTIYTYFPDGRDQLVRDAYVRTAKIVADDGANRREQHAEFPDRVVGLAAAFASVAASPEGRFYGLSGPGIFGPLSGVTGTSSSLFHAMLVEDLESLKTNGRLHADTPTEELAVLLGGSLREIGAVAAREPDRVQRLLAALQSTCEALTG